MSGQTPDPDPDELYRLAQREDPKRPPVIKDKPKEAKKGKGK